MLDFTRDYPPIEREAHQAEDEADLGPESLAYRRGTLGALAEAGEGPFDDDDYPEKRWFLTRARADLQVSDTPDPLVTGPSIRRDLWPLTRRERALGWVVGTMVREPMALVCYLVSLAAVGYVMWHLAAALTEGRLRP